MASHWRSATSCDLPDNPRAYANTRCAWEPADPGFRWERMFSDPHRKRCRKQWYRADRAAVRGTLRSLLRDANSEGEINENVIDNRTPTRYGVYGGGWWD